MFGKIAIATDDRRGYLALPAELLGQQTPRSHRAFLQMNRRLGGLFAAHSPVKGIDEVYHPDGV
jgi:hypothetical protein